MESTAHSNPSGGELADAAINLDRLCQDLLIWMERRVPSSLSGEWIEDGPEQPELCLTGMWNLAILSAAKYLFRSVVVLSNNGLRPEAVLPLRSLMEVAATQDLLFEDDTLGIALLAERHAAIRRFLERAEAHGADTKRIHQLLEGEAIARRPLSKVIPRFPDHRKDFTPLGLTASQRLERTSMKHYKRLYWDASDFAHMNARILANNIMFTHGTIRERRMDHDLPIVLWNATSIMIRILTLGVSSLRMDALDEMQSFIDRFHLISVPIKRVLAAAYPNRLWLEDQDV